jgi:hypothetical protein
MMDFAGPKGFPGQVDSTTREDSKMTTSISPVSQPHITSQPKAANPRPQTAKPPAAQSAASVQDTVSLRSTQTTNQVGGGHG